RVVLAWDLSAVPPGADPAEPAARLMVSLAALARRLPGAEVTVLTQGAAAVGVDDEVWPCRAALTGMVRTATAESMFAAIQLVDIPPGTAPEEVARLAANRYGADVVGVRDGEP